MKKIITIISLISLIGLISPKAVLAAGDGDLNGDNVVDVLDLRQALTNFSGILNLNLVLGNFGKTYIPSLPVSGEWTQDAHDAQRSGYTAEDPGEASQWTFAWFWPSPANSNPPKEGRSVTGDNKIYLPAGSFGLYALNITNGSQVWRVTKTFNAAPAYDSGFVYAGSDDGKVYKINSASGSVAGTYSAGSPVNKSILIAGGFVYAVSDNGQLHKINPGTMSLVWVYDGGSAGATPPSYSALKDVLVYATGDLYVHAVNNSSGSQKWRVKPSPNSAGWPNSFNWGWPVIAEKHGVVFLRMQLNHNVMTQGPGVNGKYPNTNADTRNFLINNPQYKNLFALDLDTGSEKFVPAVGYGSTEDYINGGPYGVMGSQPAVKILPDGKEVAYIHFRNGQGVSTDYRADGHMGEMVLDNTTAAGLVAGDLRFVKMNRDGSQGGNSYTHIIDEQTPISVAGDTIFNAHWAASTSVRIIDRSDNRGLTFSNPIQTTNNPPVVRAMKNDCPNPNNLGPHKTSCGLSYVTDGGRYFDGPGFWGYLGAVDPPGWRIGSGNTAGTAYSAGFLPRYTYVGGGYIVVEGNGGDLVVLKHNNTTNILPVGQTGSWKLIFNDEFGGTTLDTGKWSNCIYWGTETDGCWQNRTQLEWYLPKNVSVAGGITKIAARKETVQTSQGTYNYTSGFLNTDPAFNFQYGYVEIRAKLPSGRGIWPGIWMLPKNRPENNEIDIMELLGHEPNKVYFTYHYGDFESGKSWIGPDFSNDWHIFAVDWKPGIIIWYVDGVERARYADNVNVSSEPMYLMLNTQIGGAWPGSPDDTTTFPVDFDIDYVRIWQRV